MFRFAASSQPSTLTRTLMRLGAVAVACSALTWSLSGCGGGTRAKAYQPDSMVSFGDENSMMEDFTSIPTTALDPAGLTVKKVQGLVYTVNAVVNNLSLNVATYCLDQNQSALWTTPLTNTFTSFLSNAATKGYYFDSVNVAANNVSNVVTIIDLGTAVADGAQPPIQVKRTYNVTYACAASVLWNQIVAHNFGLGFQSQCAADVGGAKTYATLRAEVTDLQAQVAAHRAELHDGMLVTVMIGQQDILDVYGQVKAGSVTDSDAQQMLAARGAAAAATILDIMSTGAKVVVALTPDLGQAPLATNNGENQTQLTQYTIAFNDALKFGMGSTAAQDGRHFALVESDLFTNPITRSTSYVYNAPVCAKTGYVRSADGSQVTVMKPDGSTVNSGDADQVKFCSATTLVDGASTGTYMWADDTHYSSAGHGLIGALAASRVANNF